MPTKLLILCVSVNAVVAQLLLKRGSAAVRGLSLLDEPWKFFMAAATSPWIFSALAVQGVGYVLWMIVVSRIKLGVATASAGAAFYILTALSAWGIFGESLTPLQWTGILLITLGVTCMSLGPL